MTSKRRPPARCSPFAYLAAVLVLVSSGRSPGQTGPLPQSRPAPAADQTTPAPAKPAAAPPAEPYTSKAWGARREPEPPAYVKTVDKYGIPALKDMDWLEFGIEHRTRFELRDDDYRRPDLDNDEPFLLRSRGYLGVRKILDPLRLGLEFQDARILNSDYQQTSRDMDAADFLQAFGELYFQDALGKGNPFRFQFGRMTLSYVDRRLVDRSGWSNIPFAFDGFRVQLGQRTSDWQFDFFAVQPVERRVTRPDRADEERWFYGLVGAWRLWAKYVTLEPYYFILDEDRKDPDSADREIHTMGLHVFGPIGATGFDYDVDNAFQFGDDG